MSPLTNIEEAIRGIASLVPQVSDALQTSERNRMTGCVKKAGAEFAESSMEVSVRDGTDLDVDIKRGGGLSPSIVQGRAMYAFRPIGDSAFLKKRSTT
jgi:hypothetical protein